MNNAALMLSLIRQRYKEDPNEGMELARQFQLHRESPQSEFYHPSASGKSNMPQTALFGVDKFDEDFFRQNANLMQYSRRGASGAPLAPTKSSGPEEVAAYNYYQVQKADEYTRKLETQWRLLQEELTTKARIGVSDEDAISGIDWGKYSALEEYEESVRTRNVPQLTRPVSFSKEMLQGVLHAARAGKETGGTDYDYLPDVVDYLGLQFSQAEETKQPDTAPTFQQLPSFLQQAEEAPGPDMGHASAEPAREISDYMRLVEEHAAPEQKENYKRFLQEQDALAQFYGQPLSEYFSKFSPPGWVRDLEQGIQPPVSAQEDEPPSTEGAQEPPAGQEAHVEEPLGAERGFRARASVGASDVQYDRKDLDYYRQLVNANADPAKQEEYRSFLQAQDAIAQFYGQTLGQYFESVKPPEWLTELEHGPQRSPEEILTSYFRAEKLPAHEKETVAGYEKKYRLLFGGGQTYTFQGNETVDMQGLLGKDAHAALRAADSPYITGEERTALYLKMMQDIDDAGGEAHLARYYEQYPYIAPTEIVELANSRAKEVETHNALVLEAEVKQFRTDALHVIGKMAAGEELSGPEAELSQYMRSSPITEADKDDAAYVRLSDGIIALGQQDQLQAIDRDFATYTDGGVMTAKWEAMKYVQTDTRMAKAAGLTLSEYYEMFPEAQRTPEELMALSARAIRYKWENDETRGLVEWALGMNGEDYADNEGVGAGRALGAGAERGVLSHVSSWQDFFRYYITAAEDTDVKAGNRLKYVTLYGVDGRYRARQDIERNIAAIPDPARREYWEDVLQNTKDIYDIPFNFADENIVGSQFQVAKNLEKLNDFMLENGTFAENAAYMMTAHVVDNGLSMGESMLVGGLTGSSLAGTITGFGTKSAGQAARTAHESGKSLSASKAIGVVAGAITSVTEMIPLERLTKGTQLRSLVSGTVAKAIEGGGKSVNRFMSRVVGGASSLLEHIAGSALAEAPQEFVENTLNDWWLNLTGVQDKSGGEIMDDAAQAAVLSMIVAPLYSGMGGVYSAVSSKVVNQTTAWAEKKIDGHLAKAVPQAVESRAAELVVDAAAHGALNVDTTHADALNAELALAQEQEQSAAVVATRRAEMYDALMALVANGQPVDATKHKETLDALVAALDVRGRAQEAAQALTSRAQNAQQEIANRMVSALGEIRAKAKDQARAEILAENAVLDADDKVAYNSIKGEQHGEETGIESRGELGTVAGEPDAGGGVLHQSVEGGRTLRQADQGLSGFLALSDTVRNALTQKGVTNLNLRFSGDNLSAFVDALDENIHTHKYGPYVSSHTQQELQGAKTFLSEDGTAGVAVFEDGNIGALFKLPRGKSKRAAAELVLTALQNGGTKLDNFDGDLSRLYAQFGFIPVARVAFNPEYAPDGWKPDFGTPDVVFWMHNGDSVETVAQRYLSYPKQDVASVPIFESYEDAYAHRDQALAERAGPAPESALEAPQAVSDADGGTSLPLEPGTLYAPENGQETQVSLSAPETLPGMADGAPPSTDVQTTRSGGDGKRQFANITAQATEFLPEHIRAELMDNPELSDYQRQTNREQVTEGYLRMWENGYDQTINDLLAKERFDEIDTATALVLMAEAKQQGDMDALARIVEKYNAQGTKAGKELQARKIFLKMTPTGTVASAARRGSAQLSEALARIEGSGRMDGINARAQAAQEAAGAATQDGTAFGVQLNAQQLALVGHYKLENVKRPGIHYNRATLKQRMLEAIIASPTMAESRNPNLFQQLEYMQEGFPVTTDADINYIHDQMQEFLAKGGPDSGRDATVSLNRAGEAQANIVQVKRGEKYVSFLKTNMLSNVKTNVRNILSNVAFSPMEAVSQTIGAALDKAISSMRDTPRNVSAITHSDVMAWAKAFRQETINTYRDYFVDRVDTSKAEIERNLHQRRTFQSEALELYKNLTSFALALGDRPFWAGKLHMSISQQQRRNNTTQVTQQMMDTAIDEANYAVYQEDNRASSAINSLKKALRGAGVFVDWVIPFPKTPTNIAKRMFEYSPANIIKAFGWDLIAEGRRGMFDQKKFVMDMARGVTGTGMMLIGAALRAAGTLRTGDEDNPDYDMLNMERAAGAQPYNTVKIGDRSYAISFLQPFSTPLILGATLYDTFGKAEDFWNAFVHGGVESLDTLLDATYLKGINDLFAGGGDSLAENVVLGITGAAMSQMVPSLLRQTGNALDKYSRNTHDKNLAMKAFKRNLLATLPGIREILPANIEITGEPVESISGIYDNYINPTFVTVGKNDAALDELLRLGYALGDTSFFPKDTLYGSRSTIPNGARALTDAEKEAFKRRKGTLTFDGGQTINKNGTPVTMPGIRALIESEPYQRMADEQKAEAIHAQVLTANEGVNAEFRAIVGTKEKALPETEYTPRATTSIPSHFLGKDLWFMERVQALYDRTGDANYLPYAIGLTFSRDKIERTVTQEDASEYYTLYEQKASTELSNVDWTLQGEPLALAVRKAYERAQAKTKDEWVKRKP